MQSGKYYGAYQMILTLLTNQMKNWITTVVNVSFGEGDSETNLQRVLDAQIVDGKIKKVYGYERVISKEEN